MIDSYEFVRLVTFCLATTWTVRGSIRTVRFLRRWEERLDRWGVPRGFLRRAMLRVVARTTVLDPINLGLMLLLVGVWTYRWTL